jgi:hypothetical protein
MSDICTPEFNDQTRKLMERADELRAKLKATQRDATRMAQLEKQSAGLRSKIEAGDTSRPAKKEKHQYADAVLKAQAERNRLRAQVEELIAKGDRMNESVPKKIFGMVHDFGMASILASLHVYKKLAGAVVSTHAGSLLSDASRSIAKHVIPGVKNIAEQSPQYGEGLSLDAMKGRVQGLKEAPAEALNQLKHGQATREAAFGNPVNASNEYFTHVGTMAEALKTPGALNRAREVVHHVAGLVGRTHAAEKEFVSQPEWREGIVRESRFAVKKLQSEGKTPEEVAKIMQSEGMQSAIGAKALERAYDSKLQGKNAITSGINAMVANLDKSHSAFVNALGFAFKRLFPVRNVPINAVVRASDYVFGGAKALVEAMGKGEMTRDRADYIMKNIGRQGTVAALMTIGVLYYTKFGSVPGTFNKREQPKYTDADGKVIAPGSAAGVGSEAFHSPEAALAEVGATMAQVFHKEYGKEQGTDLALDVILKPTANWVIRAIPYTDTTRRISNTMAYGRGRKGGVTAGIGEVVGDNIRSTVIPGFVQQTAAAQDPSPYYRQPRNIGEDIETGIPGLRENVPAGHQRRPDK